MLVGFLAAEIGFIDLDLSAHVVIASLGQPSFADALGKEPCRLLRDTEFAGHLRGRDALARGRHHVDRHQPLVQTKAAFSEDSASADAEMLAAVTAAIGHRLVIFDLGNRQAAAMGARHFAVPAVALEVDAGRFLVGEPFEELVEADGFGLVLGHEI